MPNYAKVFPFTGLNTRANEDGLPEPEATIAQNCRFGSGGFEKRLGSVRALLATSTAKSMDFDAASSEYVAIPIDVRVWTLPTKFTIEACVAPDDVTGARTVFYAGATTPSVVLDTNSSNWRWRIWDSEGTLTTVTVGAASAATTTIQLLRDGASLTTRLNNVAGGTGSMSATLSTRPPVGDLRFARNDATDYYDGKIDYIRGFGGVVRSNHNDRLVRFADPKAEYVLFDYGGPASGTTVYDESRWENHGEALNTPTVAATLCHNPAPVRAIHAYTNYSREKRVLVQAGGALYDVVVP